MTGRPSLTRNNPAAWCGCCSLGQRAELSSPRRRLMLNPDNSATDRRWGVRNVVCTAFESHGARPARILPLGVLGRPPAEHAPWCGVAIPSHENVDSATTKLDLESTRTSCAKTKGRGAFVGHGGGAMLSSTGVRTSATSHSPTWPERRRADVL